MGNIALTVSDTPDFREGERVFLFPGKVSSARSKGSLRKPKGPDSGTPGSILHFHATTTDPDGDEAAFKFDWGDGTESG